MAQNWISEKHGKEVRENIVEMIRKANADGVDIHRAVIARELSVTRSTAGKHCDRLIEEKLVREVNGRMLELVVARTRAKAPAKKTTARKPAKKAAPVAKKAPAKKAAPVAKKPAAKKAAPTKAVAKKTTARKAAPARPARRTRASA